MSTPTITIVGNLTREPELRTTRNGKNYCSFTIAANDRRKNEQTGEWENTSAIFLNCTVWDTDYGSFASNVANTLHKGMQVIAEGQIKQGSYTAKDGTERTTVEMNVSAIGPDLRKYHANVINTQQSGGAAAPAATQQQPQMSSQQRAQQQAYANTMGGGAVDPWAAPGQQPTYDTGSETEF